MNTYPRGPNFTPFRPATSRFRDTGLSKKQNCTQWTQNDLKHLSLNSTLCTLFTHPEAQISLCFNLRSLVFQIIEVFGFPIGYNGEIQKFVKNQKLKISKLQNSTFVRTTVKKIQKMFERIQKRFEGGSFEVLAPIGSHVNENEKYSY